MYGSIERWRCALTDNFKSGLRIFVTVDPSTIRYGTGSWSQAGHVTCNSSLLLPLIFTLARYGTGSCAYSYHVPSSRGSATQNSSPVSGERQCKCESPTCIQRRSRRCRDNGSCQASRHWAPSLRVHRHDFSAQAPKNMPLIDHASAMDLAFV